VLLAPEPESPTLRLGSDAVDVRLSAPLVAPVELGVKATASVRLCPAASVVGEKLPKLKPGPVTAACETEALAPPVFLMVMYCTWLVPTGVVPKFTGEGVGTIYAAVTAFAESGNVVLLERCLPLLPIPLKVVIVILPLALPAVCG